MVMLITLPACWAGLLVLREKQPFTLFVTPDIAAILDANPIFGVLDRACVTRKLIVPETDIEILPGLNIRLFETPGKVPLYMEGEHVVTDQLGGQTTGIELSAGSSTAFYIPGCAGMTPALSERLRGARLVFFDGTVFHDDEMERLGAGSKTGRRMGHMAMAGISGSLAAFASLQVERKIYVHINNTNPVWRPDSPERAEIEAAGWQIAHDGMEIAL